MPIERQKDNTVIIGCHNHVHFVDMHSEHGHSGHRAIDLCQPSPSWTGVYDVINYSIINAFNEVMNIVKPSAEIDLYCDPLSGFTLFGSCFCKYNTLF